MEMMTTEEDSNEFLDSITKCVFCNFQFIYTKEDLQKSKFLECFHPICATCHSVWIFNEIKTCPECQICLTKCDLLDTKIVQEVVSIEKESPDNGGTFCGMHKDIRANRWCQDCSEFVCHVCVERHGQLKITQSHVIKSIEDYYTSLIGERPEKFNCQLHPNEELVIFCSTCEKLTCRDCQLSDHCKHNYKFVNEVIDSTKRELFQKNHALKYHLLILEKASYIVETKRHHLLQQQAKVKLKIRNCFNQIVRELERKRNKILSDLDSVVENKIAALDSKQQSLDRMSKMVRHTTSLTSHVLNHSSDSSILFSKKHLVHWLDSVESNGVMVPNPKSHIEVVFASNADKIINAMGDLGSVSLALNFEENMKEFCDDVEELHSGTGMQPQGNQTENDRTQETSSCNDIVLEIKSSSDSDCDIPVAKENSSLSGADLANRDNSTEIIQSNVVAAEKELVLPDSSKSAEAGKSSLSSDVGKSTKSSDAGPSKSSDAGPSKSSDTRKPSKSSDVVKPSKSSDAGKTSKPSDAGKPSKSSDARKPSKSSDVEKPSKSSDAGKPKSSDAGKPKSSDAGKPSKSSDAGKPKSANVGEPKSKSGNAARSAPKCSDAEKPAPQSSVTSKTSNSEQSSKSSNEIKNRPHTSKSRHTENEKIPKSKALSVCRKTTVHKGPHAYFPKSSEKTINRSLSLDADSISQPSKSMPQIGPNPVRSNSLDAELPDSERSNRPAFGVKKLSSLSVTNNPPAQNVKSNHQWHHPVEDTSRPNSTPTEVAPSHVVNRLQSGPLTQNVQVQKNTPISQSSRSLNVHNQLIPKLPPSYQQSTSSARNVQPTTAHQQALSKVISHSYAPVHFRSANGQNVYMKQVTNSQVHFQNLPRTGSVIQAPVYYPSGHVQQNTRPNLQQILTSQLPAASTQTHQRSNQMAPLPELRDVCRSIFDPLSPGGSSPNLSVPPVSFNFSNPMAASPTAIRSRMFGEKERYVPQTAIRTYLRPPPPAYNKPSAGNISALESRRLIEHIIERSLNPSASCDTSVNSTSSQTNNVPTQQNNETRLTNGNYPDLQILPVQQKLNSEANSPQPTISEKKDKSQVLEMNNNLENQVNEEDDDIFLIEPHIEQIVIDDDEVDVCAVCSGANFDVTCLKCKRFYHLSCLFFDPAKRSKPSGTTFSACILCENIPPLPATSDHKMDLLVKKVCQRVFFEMISSPGCQLFFLKKENPEDTDSQMYVDKIKRKLEVDGFTGGVVEFTKDLKQTFFDCAGIKSAPFKFDPGVVTIFQKCSSIIKQYLPASIDIYSTQGPIKKKN